jgi:hypothetical protein
VSFLDELPAKHGPEREAAILKAVQDGRASIRFETITSTYNGHTAEFQVFDDALKIDGLRVNVSAATEQRIADHMACLLMTARIADLRFAQAKTILKPHSRWDQSGGFQMSTTEWMGWHSDKIQADLDKLGGEHGIVATVGKHWILDEKLSTPHIPNQACNYGWHYTGQLSGVPADLPVSYKDMPGVRMIQSRGYHHDSAHSDYSQICVLVARDCKVDGKMRDLVAVLQDDEMAFLASHTGKMSLWRQPDVPDPGYVFIVPEE